MTLGDVAGSRDIAAPIRRDGFECRFLALLRDLRAVNSHLASIGYAISSSRDRVGTPAAAAPPLQ